VPEILIEPVSNGFADVPGFTCAGVACDIRNSGKQRLDLALFVSAGDAAAAGVFTTNAVQAAPVKVSASTLANTRHIRAIVANSGNANACTGKQGMRDALEMQQCAARALGVPSRQVLVCSTGRIGEWMPMDKVRAGIQSAAADLGATAGHGERAADAILTSDTRRKTVTARVRLESGHVVTIAGVAKGAGMIEPNMATMLSFIATDAKIAPDELQDMLSAAVRVSFNGITVDGDMSTNDTVLLLANGASGVTVGAGGDAAAREAFIDALTRVCRVLAEKIVGDGEKITKVVRVCVSGAASHDDAERVARAIGNSLLVKSSWFGNDPNWGRLLDSAGYSGARLVEERLDLHYASDDGATVVPVFLHGEVERARKPEWKAIVSQPRFRVLINLNLGEESTELLATDLTEQYVAFNKSE